MALVLNSTGKIHDDPDFSSWSTAGSGVRDFPAYCIGARSPIVFLSPIPSSPDAGGIREGQINVAVDGTWWGSHDAGDGTGGAGGPWHVHIVESIDRGLDWDRHGPTSFGISPHAARGNLFMWEEPGGASWVIFPMSAEGNSSNVPQQSFQNDIYTGDTPIDTWVFVDDFLKNPTGGQFDSDSAYITSVVESGGTFYGFYSAISDVNAFQCGIATASDIVGPYTRDDAGILPAAIAGDAPENPKPWWSEVLDCWVMSTNQIDIGAGATLTSRFFFSDSLLDWSESFHNDPMRMSPNFGTNAVGIISPFYYAGGIPVEDAHGRMPITYDSGGTGHHGRSLYYAWLMPAPQCLELKPPFLFEDKFNRANGSIDGDNGWDVVTGSASIASGKLDLGSTAGAHIAIQMGVSEADPWVQASLTMANGTGVAIYFNWIDALNNYKWEITWNGSSNEATLFVINGGSYSAVGGASTLGALGTSIAAISVRRRGSAIKLFIGETEALSRTDSTILTAGAIGFGNAGAGSGARLVDNVLVRDYTSTTHLATRTLTNSDGVFRFFPQLRNGAPVVKFYFRLTGTTTGGTGYFVQYDVNGLSLYELTGGTPNLLEANTGTIEPTLDDLFEVRLEAFGPSLVGYLSGEEQFNVSNGTTASGTSIALEGEDAEVRLPSIWADDEITIDGLTAGQVVTLRGPGGIPVASDTAAGSSLSFDGLTNFPISFVDVDGDDHYLTSNDDLWGGDQLTLSGVSVVNFLLLLQTGGSDNLLLQIADSFLLQAQGVADGSSDPMGMLGFFGV